MFRNSRPAGWREAAGVVVALLLAACGGGQPSSAPESDSHPAASSGPATSGAPTARAAGIAGRTQELVSPDDATVVFLYYDLAGLAVPVESWVEEDPQVKYAPGPEKAARRAELTAALQAGAAAVHGVGRLRITMNAKMSEYDPAYSEFTLRALAPSSTVQFQAFGQKVGLRFANGRTAQIWKVPAAEAQAIRDRIAYQGNVDMDVLLGIDSVQPGPDGGTIVTQVLEYELRDGRSGATLGRVSIGGD